MKYISEFRDETLAQALVDKILRRATRRWTIMEVCGGQTHGLLRHGIDASLEDVVEMVHGPGCPVCVTDSDLIDTAIELSLRDDVLLATFGDMLRVPGSRTSLAAARGLGAHVAAVYSPLDALALAEKHPERQVVLFAVGFETTSPATALTVKQAAQRGLDNFSLLAAHVRVQPAMELLMEAADCRIDGFLAAGHVCAVMGYESYHTFCERYRVPVVVTGFEPVDLLTGILACLEQLESSEHDVENAYVRSVAEAGNAFAQDIVREVYEVCDRCWRGMGIISRGGLRLRDEWRRFDAHHKFTLSDLSCSESTKCCSGDILSGRIKPPACPEFGRSCTPQSPLGAPMVSSEGACAAYYTWHRSTLADK